MNIGNFFDVNTIFFTLFDYPMSYLEFFGTIFTGWSVYLAAKNKVSSWPIGIVGIILYFFLFYQIRLYSDLIEQVYYFATSFWGWWIWTHPGKNNKSAELPVGTTPTNYNRLAIAASLILTLVLGYFMSRIHLIFPTVFPEVASLPYLDAFTTVLSFVATIYLAKRKIENWSIWIIVDIIGVGLYYYKGVIFLSLLYLAFLLNAFRGYFEWKRELVITSEK